jgi:hypothetical protein
MVTWGFPTCFRQAAGGNSLWFICSMQFSQCAIVPCPCKCLLYTKKHGHEYLQVCTILLLIPVRILSLHPDSSGFLVKRHWKSRAYRLSKLLFNSISTSLCSGNALTNPKPHGSLWPPCNVSCCCGFSSLTKGNSTPKFYWLCFSKHSKTS